MWPFILSDRLLIVALVGLYPHQLANQTQAHLQAEAFSEASFSKCLMRYSYIHSVLAPLSKCCPHLEGRLLTRYSPVRHLVFTEINTPFDLHVLSTPPAFILSQDQTLHCKISFLLRHFRRSNSVFVDNLLKDSKSININIDGSCFSVHHIYITYGAPACTTCLFILNLSKNSHLCLFPFFPEMFCKDKAFISKYKKIIAYDPNKIKG